MNEQAIRHALSLANTNYVSEATKIAPQVLQRIVDGAVPTPEEIDLLFGYFKGEFFLSGTSFQWERKTPNVQPTRTLPFACEHVPGPDIKYEVFAAPPTLKPGPKPTGTGATSEGITGTGARVK